MKMSIRWIIISAACIFGALHSSAQYQVPNKMKWWHSDRFGMFIHFGSYSQLERGEWAFSIENWSKWSYQQQCSAKFNPSKFDAAQIVELAKTAGMRYLVITAKHHEGFCMWNTNVDSFRDSTGEKIYSLPAYTPYKRDLLMELKTECNKQGIKFGLYYSILDWSHQSQRITKDGVVFSKMYSMDMRASYIRDVKSQLKELIERYDPAILWFDGDWCSNPDSPTLNSWWTSLDGSELYNYIIKLKPSIVINERVKRHSGLGDFECPEQTVPDLPLGRLWETCATLNGGWGYDQSREQTYRPAREIIAELVRVVARDGNYLLNIGPRADGSLSLKTNNVLDTIGRWVRNNEEAIFGAERSPFRMFENWGDITSKGNRIYLILTGRYHETVSIPYTPVKRIYSLRKKVGLQYTVSSDSIKIVTPLSMYDPSFPAVVVVESNK